MSASVVERGRELLGRATVRPSAQRSFWRRLAFVVAAYLACLVVFAVFATAQGANPSTLFHTMLKFSVADWPSLQRTLIRSVPIILAALACTIPARAGLVNVGGEGQIIMGSVAGVGVGLWIGTRVTGPLSWLLISLGGMLAGGIWAGICGYLRVRLNANESVTTLFLNFLANDIMLYVTYDLWRNGGGTGLPETTPLAAEQMLPRVFGLELNLSVLITAVVVVGVWLLLRFTGWGFSLRVVGGNMEAAYRAGLPVRSILVSSMLVGGALAGLGGALNVMAVEGALRPGMTASFGFIAFLANFLGGSRPFAVAGAAVLFGAIAMSGNGLQLVEHLDGSAVNVLLGLIVMTMLVISGRRKEAFQ